VSIPAQPVVDGFRARWVRLHSGFAWGKVAGEMTDLSGSCRSDQAYGPFESVASEPIGFDRHRLRPFLLRIPAAGYLLLGDFLAFACSCLARGSLTTGQALGLPVMIACLSFVGLYRSRLSMSVLDDLPAMVGGTLAAVTTEFAVALANVEPTFSIVRVSDFGLLLGPVVVIRAVAFWTVRRARRCGYVRHTALIVGAGFVGIRLAEELRSHRDHGLDPVGFIDSRPRVKDNVDLPAPVFGGYDQLAEVIKDFDARVVIVAFGGMPESDLVEVLRTCDRLDCEMFIVPRLFEMHATTRDVDQVRGIPLIRFRRGPFRRPSWRVKRLIDIAASGLGLLLLSPLLLACALAVRLEGGPGVLFRQVRVGLDDCPFELLKFRSLRPVSDEETSTAWNIASDERLGPVGRFLRKTSLDELPQLRNIFVGEMSLVGPRPERPYFVDTFAESVPRYAARNRVPAGLTGWAQVNGLRGDTSIAERARYDNFYIENWSLWVDAKILLRTFEQVLRRRGA